MIHVIGPRDPRNPRAINVTSRSKTWSRELSPFVLGPVDLYDGYISQNVENGWQYCKTYPTHVDDNKNPNHDYWDWAVTGWNSKRACRYPMGKDAKPLYSLWKGRKLSYVEARKEIYLPLYSNAVRQTRAFNQLVEEALLSDIWLWDFDAYDHHKLNMSYEDVLNDPLKKCGHGFVLAFMLEGACGFNRLI